MVHAMLTVQLAAGGGQQRTFMLSLISTHNLDEEIDLAATYGEAARQRRIKAIAWLTTVAGRTFHSRWFSSVVAGTSHGICR